MSERKSIFITGAASGLGLGAARRFAREGWFVGLADINSAGLKAALDTVGRDKAASYLLDVREGAAWGDALAIFVRAAGGRLDVLLNNAGVASYGYLENQSDAEVARQVDVNITGVIYGARAALPYLMQTPGSQLINMSSCASLYGSPKLSIYCATKFAVRGLSEALDIEFARHGVGVKCIMPWFIDTPILDSGSASTNEKMSDAIRAGGTPVYSVEECADTVWNAVHATKLKHIVGARGKQLSWLSRLAPGLVRRQLLNDAKAGRVPGS